VNRAKVGVSAGGACCDREFLIRVERGRFLKLLLNAHDGVRFLVPINPGYLLTGPHRDGLRIEGKILDLDLGLTGAAVARVLDFAGQGEKREGTNTARKRRHRGFRNECSHNVVVIGLIGLTKG
jgi:hypothetical protein